MGKKQGGKSPKGIRDWDAHLDALKSACFDLISTVGGILLFPKNSEQFAYFNSKLGPRIDNLAQLLNDNRPLIDDFIQLPDSSETLHRLTLARIEAGESNVYPVELFHFACECHPDFHKSDPIPFDDGKYFEMIDLQIEVTRRICRTTYSAESPKRDAKRAPAEPDGPVQPAKWRHKGKIVPGKLPPTAFALVNFLWNSEDRSEEITELAEPVFGDSVKLVEIWTVQNHAKMVNKFFKSANIPLRIATKQNPTPRASIVSAD